MLILPSKKIKDIRGEIFGRLIVQEYSHTNTSSNHQACWICDCSCGNQSIVSSQHLRSGATQSCGCLAKEQSAIRIKKLHNTGKHLYIFKCGDFIKIGRANDVNQRLSQIRAANPYPVELIKILENQGEREKEFHERFREYLHTGEWFKADGCEAVDLV